MLVKYGRNVQLRNGAGLAARHSERAREREKNAQILAKTKNQQKQIEMNDGVYRGANEIIIYWREYTFYDFKGYKIGWSALCTVHFPPFIHFRIYLSCFFFLLRSGSHHTVASIDMPLFCRNRV